MAGHLKIPDIVEAEPLFEMEVELGGLTFNVVISAGDTSHRLTTAGHNGELLPSVTVVTDGGTFVLESVSVSGFDFVGSGDAPMVRITLRALSAQRSD